MGIFVSMPFIDEALGNGRIIIDVISVSDVLLVNKVI